MVKFRQLLITISIAATLVVSGAFAQTNLTQILDTITNPDGTLFNGTVVITWNATQAAVAEQFLGSALQLGFITALFRSSWSQQPRLHQAPTIRLSTPVATARCRGQKRGKSRPAQRR